MQSTSLVMRSLANSPMAPSEKSKIAHWIERATGHGQATLTNFRKVGHTAMSLAVEGGHAFRQGSESVLTGAALGALAHAGHIDATIPIGKGKTVKGPVDLAAGSVMLATSVGMAMHEGTAAVAPEFRNIGCAALAIGTFRKTEAFLDAKKGAPSGAKPKVAGDHEATVREALGLFT